MSIEGTTAKSPPLPSLPKLEGRVLISRLDATIIENSRQDSLLQLLSGIQLRIPVTLNQKVGEKLQITISKLTENLAPQKQLAVNNSKQATSSIPQATDCIDSLPPYPKTAMDLLRPTQPIQATQQQTSSQAPSKGGQHILAQIQGRVIKDLGNGFFLIKASHQEIPLESKFPLEIGQKLQLAVTQKEPLQLRVIPNEKTVYEKEKPLPLQAAQKLSAKLKVLDQPIALQTLTTLLSPTSSTAPILSLSNNSYDTLLFFIAGQKALLQGGAEGANVLKKMVERLGLRHEQNLTLSNGHEKGTLKNSILEILAKSGNEHELQGKAEHILRTLENFQLANISHNESSSYLLPLPFSFIEKGFLHIEYNENDHTKGEYKKNFFFSLYLQMSALGNLQIDFHKKEQEVILHIHCDSEQKLLFLQEHLAELKERISLFFPYYVIGLSSDAQDPTSKLIQLARPHEQNLVDSIV